MDLFYEAVRRMLLKMTSPFDIKRRREIMNASHATLMAMFIAACGGGGAILRPPLCRLSWKLHQRMAQK